MSHDNATLESGDDSVRSEDNSRLSGELAAVFYQVLRLVFVMEDSSALQELPLLQARLLRLINEDPGRKVVELAQSMGVSVSHVSRMLASLDSLGLVERVDDSHDRRIVRVFVSDSTREALRRREELRVARMKSCVAEMSPEAAVRLVESLHLMKRAAELSVASSKPTPT